MECRVFEMQIASRRVVDRLSPGAAGTDVVRLPPAGKFWAFPPQALRERYKGGIAGPKVVRRTKLSDDASCLIGPSLAKQSASLGIDEEVEQDVAIAFGDLREVGEDLCRRLIPGEHVGSPSCNVGGTVKALDDTPHGLRHELADERATVCAETKRSQMRVLAFA